MSATPPPLPPSSEPDTTLTHARRILRRSGRVLLLLDIQKAMLSDDSEIGVPSSHTIRSNLSSVLKHAREADPPPLIVHVRNMGDAGEPDEPDTPGWELIFPPGRAELVVDKRKNNAFVGTCLDGLIPEDAEIVVAGFQSDFSVQATCQAARVRGNEVLLIRGAHATQNRIEVMHGGKIMPAHWIESQVEMELKKEGIHILEMADLRDLFTDR